MRVLCPEAPRPRAHDQPKDLLDWEAPPVEFDKVLVPAIDRGGRRNVARSCTDVGWRDRELPATEREVLPAPRVVVGHLRIFPQHRTCMSQGAATNARIDDLRADIGNLRTDVRRLEDRLDRLNDRLRAVEVAFGKVPGSASSAADSAARVSATGTPRASRHRPAQSSPRSRCARPAARSTGLSHGMRLRGISWSVP